MKALSLSLVKGSIDEVDQKVHMTWVQPRVLDREQVREHITWVQLRVLDREQVSEHMSKIDHQRFLMCIYSETNFSEYEW